MRAKVPVAGRRRHMVAAVVLGATLSTLGGSAQAAGPSEQALTDISRYCTACWRNARLAPDYWTDCTQEVFVRLLERVPTSQWDRVLNRDGDEHREFIRAIDAVKKRSQRSRKVGGLATDVTDPADPAEARRRDDREALAQSAVRVLTDRQWRVLQLSLAGWSVPEIASELQTSAARVSDEKYKAVRKLRDHLNPTAAIF